MRVRQGKNHVHRSKSQQGFFQCYVVITIRKDCQLRYCWITMEVQQPVEMIISPCNPPLRPLLRIPPATQALDSKSMESLVIQLPYFFNILPVNTQIGFTHPGTRPDMDLLFIRDQPELHIIYKT